MIVDTAVPRRVDGGEPGIWAALARRLDFGSFVPRPVGGIERADLRTRDGTPYALLKDPHGDGGARTYVRLDVGYLEPAAGGGPRPG